MFRVHLLFITIAAYLLLNHRIFLKYSTGGRGILPFLELLIFGAVVILLLTEQGDSSLLALNTRRFRMWWAPYLGLTIALPLFGVLYADYPVRTVVTAFPGLRTLSFIIIGCWIAKSDDSVGRVAARYMILGIFIEAVLAGGQYLHNQGISWSILEAQYRWDIGSQSTYSDTYIITGRSIGTFINPNELGYWSVIAFWFSAFALNGWMSTVTATMALATLFLSQSRGSMFALVGSAIILIGYLAFSGAKVSRRVMDYATTCILGCLLALTLAVAGLQDKLSDSPLLSRFGRGIQVLAEGASADRNAEGRVLAWKQAMVFYSDHIAGTWGEPQFLFGHFMDSDYVRVLLQGSPFYLVTLIMAIGAGIWSLPYLEQWGRLLAMCSVVLAINAMSANPLNYSASAIGWMALGYYLRLRQRALVNADAHCRMASPALDVAYSCPE